MLVVICDCRHSLRASLFSKPSSTLCKLALALQPAAAQTSAQPQRKLCGRGCSQQSQCTYVRIMYNTRAAAVPYPMHTKCGRPVVMQNRRKVRLLGACARAASAAVSVISAGDVGARCKNSNMSGRAQARTHPFAHAGVATCKSN